MRLSVSKTSAEILPMLLAQGGFHSHALPLRLVRASDTGSGIAVAVTQDETSSHNWFRENFGRRLRSYRSLSADRKGSATTELSHDVEPFVLGSRDANFEISRPYPFLVGKRRLDSLLTNADELKVVYLQTNLTEIADVLTGGKATLARNTPILLLDIVGALEVARLFEIMSNIEYDLYDTCLCSVVGIESNAAGVRNIDRRFVALPRDSSITSKLITSLFPMADPVYEELGWDDALGTAIIQEAKQGAVQIEARAIEKSRYEMFELPCEGFYSTEFYDGMSWRWLGPRPSGTIYLPVQPPGRYRLEISLVALVPGMRADEIRIFVDGIRQTVYTENHEHGGRLSIVLNMPQTANLLRLLICCPMARRASDYDPRLVCVSIGHIDMQRM